jgi:hypothetical protein
MTIKHFSPFWVSLLDWSRLSPADVGQAVVLIARELFFKKLMTLVGPLQTFALRCLMVKYSFWMGWILQCPTT